MEPQARPLDSARRESLLIAVFLMLLPYGVFYWLAPFLGSLTIGNDYGVYAIEQQLELQYSLHHGSFPLYAPGFAGGRSAAALTMGQLYHPLPHLAARLPGYWRGSALEWSTFLRLAMLGAAQTGLFFLLRRAALSRLAAFVLSFLAVYNLRMLDLFRYGSSLENYTGLLYLGTAMAWYWFRPGGAALPALMTLATVMLVCGGFPPIMYLCLLGAGLLALVLPFALEALAPGPGPLRPRLAGFAAGVAGSVAAGLLLSGVYILPFLLDFMGDNVRRLNRPYAWSLAYSDSWGGTLNSFFAPLRADVHGAFGNSPLVIFALVAPPLLAFARLGRRDGDNRPPARIGVVLWALAAVVLLCGLGGLTPVHHLFWKYVPFAGSFRVPGRIHLLLPFLFLLILAGLARDLERAGPPAAPGRLLRTPGAALFAGVVALFVLYRFLLLERVPPPGRFHPGAINGAGPGVEAAVFWLGLASLLLVGAYGASGRCGRPRLRVLCGAMLAAAVLAQTTVEMRFGTWVEAKPAVWTLEQMDRSKKLDLAFAGFPGYGLEPAAVIRQMERSSLEWRLAQFFRSIVNVSTPEEAYDYLATRGRAGTLVVESGESASPEKPSGAQTAPPTDGVDRVELRYSSFNRLRFSVEARFRGYVLLSVPFAPGWRAHVDGRPAAIVRGNGYALAVFVPAGVHDVEFSYFSAATQAGFLIACATLAVLLLLAWRGRRAGAALAVALPCAIYFIWQASLYRGDDLGTRYSWTSAELPARGNLAHGKRTRMSSIFSDIQPTQFYAGLGVDGRREERPFVTSPKDPSPWWEVDLGRQEMLGEVDVFGSGNAGPHLPLLVQVSADGENYRTVLALGAAADAVGKAWRIPLAGIEARHLRLRSSGRGAFALGEVEVYAAGR